MNKELNPNLVAIIFTGFAVLILAVLPIRLQIVPNGISAQETAPAATAVTVAQMTGKVVEYTLKTVLGQTPPMAFIGVGGEIDGVINPELTAHVGDTVRITIINGDPVQHDFVAAELGVHSGHLMAQDQSETIEFTPTQPGDYEYHCSVPGHRDIGMKGVVHISGEATAVEAVTAESEEPETAPTVVPAVANAVSITRNPADLPPPIGDRAPTTVQVDLTAVEVDGALADGTTYHSMTFNGQVPGPMIRVRVGDTVAVHLQNDTTSTLPHSIDLHAVTGPGGGAVYTQTLPGAATSFTFQALQPGLYVYHCATASIGHHISSGMYGLILVEPEGGLPAVDREFYVMQGEIYTVPPFGTQGHLDFSHEKMLDERPDYFVFNGAAGALTQDESALRANVGESVRIYFGVGGPNAISSFHVIGEIFDRVYDQASLTSAPLTDVQTTIVPPGGATVVEFTLDVPGRYLLVDHAISRVERGLAGYLYAEGDETPAIFHSEGTADAAGH